MRIAVDTNRYVDFCKGDPAALKIIQSAREIFMPLVTLAELRAGFLCGIHKQKNERTLTQFLNSPRVSILPPDDQTTHHYARLFLQLKTQGTPIPTNDLWIAALVVQHDLILFSNDKHFEYMPQIPRV